MLKFLNILRLLSWHLLAVAVGVGQGRVLGRISPYLTEIIRL